MIKCAFIALLLFTHLHGQTTGSTAIQTAAVASSNSWQNWAFAGLGFVTAASWVAVVALNSGRHAH